MKQVAEKLTRVLNGFHVQVYRHVRDFIPKAGVKHTSGELFGETGLKIGTKKHSQSAVALVFKPKKGGFHATRQKQLRDKLTELSQLFAEHKLNVVFQIPHGKSVYAVVSINRKGLTGWTFKRTMFVERLKHLIGEQK